MIVLLFKSELRRDIDTDAYQVTRARMMELVHEIPGFISYKKYISEDGDTLAIARFASEEALAAWRNHPEHVQAQRRGHDEFYESYRIEVCRTERDYGWSRKEETAREK